MSAITSVVASKAISAITALAAKAFTLDIAPATAVTLLATPATVVTL